MTLADAEAVATLIRVAFAAQPVMPDPPMSALRITADDIAAHLSRGGGGAVVETDGALAGSALWEAKDGGLYISRVAVAPECRRRGIAQTLMHAAEAVAVAQGLPHLHLSTRLALQNNRRLFAACGFVEAAQTAHPGYHHPTSVAMIKCLAVADARRREGCGAADGWEARKSAEDDAHA
jgi:ribosomal protein S18 acetylase RimI-like enzyme